MTNWHIVPSTSNVAVSTVSDLFCAWLTAFVHDNWAGGASCVTAVDSSAEALQAGAT